MISSLPYFSADEVVDTGERIKRVKSGKEKKRRHRVEKMKGEEVESADDYDRLLPVGEFDDQDFPSRGSSKRKLVEKGSAEAVKKKRPLEESSSYRERNSRSSSSKISAGVMESDRGREGNLWKPSAGSDGHKQTDASLDRYRDDRHASARKTKSYLTDEDYSRRGRDRERDRPADGTADYGSRKRKRLSMLN